mmetsp:Transcript_130965/g.245127  ORF Transcript_130965/g.245127 Transcript_130965/m.245127 type:complete len:211 (-) Transcript_130965:2302-2934(-)
MFEVRSLVSTLNHSLGKPVVSSTDSLNPMLSHCVLAAASIFRGTVPGPFPVETQTLSSTRSMRNFKSNELFLVTRVCTILLNDVRIILASLSVQPGMLETKCTKMREVGFFLSTAGSRLTRSMSSKACNTSCGTTSSKLSRVKTAGETVRTRIVSAFLSFVVPVKIPVRPVFSFCTNTNSSARAGNSKAQGAAGRKCRYSMISFQPAAFV